MEIQRPQRKNLTTAAIHVMVWSSLILVLVYLNQITPFRAVDIKRLLRLNVLILVIYYLNHFVLIPRLLFQRKYVLYVACIAAIIAGTLFMLNAFAPVPPQPEVGLPSPQGPPRGMHGPRIIPVILVFFSILLGITFRLIGRWHAREKQEREIESKQLETELSFLKNQISPHFFFNTLNSIYSLTATDAAKAQQVVHRLSKLMRYVLYESEKSGRVALHREVEFLESYIELMRARLPASVTVHFSNAVTDGSVLVPPLLIVPLIENAFKYGISLQHPVEINLTLLQSKGRISFETKNGIHRVSENQDEGGIGLSNLKRRLELIYDSSEYELQAEARNQHFYTALSIRTWPSVAST